jgi:hypothetical protein
MSNSRDVHSSLLLAVLLASATVLVSSGTASAAAMPSTVRYVGTTSQGFAMEFEVGVSNGPRITSFQFDYGVACLLDGVKQRVGVGYGTTIAVHDGQFAFDDLSPDSSVSFSGSISESTAAGLTRWAFPAFTSDEVPQTCTTPDLAWTATRASADARSAGMPKFEHRQWSTTGSWDALTIVRNRSRSVPLVTTFQGTNAQGLSMQFDVATRQRPLQIVGYEFEYRLRCQLNGQTQRLGIGGGWPMPTPIRDGHFDVDALDQATAFEFSGSIAPNLAAGLSRFAMPEFTRHEVPQTCTTGDLAWTAGSTPLGGPGSSPAQRR